MMRAHTGKKPLSVTVPNYGGMDLRHLFQATVAQGLAVPGLDASITNADQKLRWVEPLGFDSLDELYREHPVMQTYLEYHINSRGEPMSLEGRPYLLDIIIDEAAHVAVQKSVQCGITEVALVRAYTLAMLGLGTLYVLPGNTERNRFVADRVDKQMDRSPHYQAYLAQGGGSDATGMKHFARGVLHFVGSNTPGEFSQYPADFMVADERDLCHPGNLGMARDRLSESPYKRILSIGNPRKPGAAHTVGAVYDRSDGKQWWVLCEHCEHYQVLDWYDHFVYKGQGGEYKLRDKKGRPVCLHCEKPFNRCGPGEWDPQRPEKKISGYQISKLFTASADILELFSVFQEAQHNETFLQLFHESDLGIYYMPSASHITLENLLACVDKTMPTWGQAQERPVVMGVDVGAVLHVKASYLDDRGRRVAMTVQTLADFSTLNSLVNQLQPSAVVIDALPEVHKVQEFAAHCEYPVWPCMFGSTEMVQPLDYDWDKRTGLRKVRANRTAVMDASYADILNGGVKWPASAQWVDQFFYQMQVPVRQLDRTMAKGAGRFIWSKGEDHYRLADTYEMIAAKIVQGSGVTLEWLN